MAKDFFTLSEQEQANLSREDVKGFIAYELMRKGVPQAIEPTYEDVFDIEMTPKTMYSVEFTEADGGWRTVSVDILFETQEQAVKAGELFIKHGKMSNSEYLNGKSYRSKKGSCKLKVESVDVYDINDIEDNRSALNELDAKRRRNATAKREYEEALKAVEYASTEIWEQYATACVKAGEMDNIRATMKQYVELAGDEETAYKFLENTYGVDKVADFVEWEAGNGN